MNKVKVIMTQEDRQLLLKDLCARLPYGVKVVHLATTYSIQYVDSKFDEVKLDGIPYTVSTGYIKPYLRPMSSMTEEEEKEYSNFIDGKDSNPNDLNWLATHISDWLDRRMFDHRGLISKGLALEAPEGMYNFKD